MNIFDDFDPFGYEGEEEFGGDPKDRRERRKKYFEEELKRHREDKRRKLSSSESASNENALNDSSEDLQTPEPRFLHPEILEELVDYCIENEKFEEALDFALLLTDRAPFNGDGWHRRGMLEAHHAEFEKAILSYERALALNPTDNELLINYGVALDGAGRTEEALEIFNRTLATNPSNDEALFNKGICFEKAERYADAIAIFQYLKDVKEFAMMLVKDHQAFLQKLQPFPVPDPPQQNSITFLGKCSPDGHIIWVRKYIDYHPAPGYNDPGITDFKVDADENVYFLSSITSGYMKIDTATYYPKKGGSTFIVKFDSSGALKWLNVGAAGVTVSIDASQNAYLFSSTVINKYDRVGKLVKQLVFDSIDNDVKLRTLATDPLGNVYVVGYFRGTFTLDGQVYNSNGSYKDFIFKLDSGLKVQWSVFPSANINNVNVNRQTNYI